MKVLYVYDKMPGIYQNYLNSLLENAREVLSIKTLSYDAGANSDYNMSRNGWKNRYQQFLYQLNFSELSSVDLKIMTEYDVVHLQHSFLWQRLLPLLNLKKRPKVVITLRGGDTYLKPWTYIRMQEFYSDKSHLVDAFVVMSQHQKDYLQRWGVEEEKIHVIPISYGQHTAMVPKLPSKTKIKLISAFRMTWEKNIQGHIEFANILKARHVNFEYDIYGDGKDLNQLYFLVDKFDLKSEVNIKGKVPNMVLQKIYGQYDFCIQLSISESLGMSVIEAQGQGVPCIVSNTGGLPEVVIKGKTGIVAEVNDLENMVDSCVQLWSDEETYASYSKMAIQHVNNNYMPVHELKKLQELYMHI